MSRTNLKGALGRIKSTPATESRLPLDQIKPRTDDTRPLNQAHVEALAESIAALGLIQPIAVDTNGVLLAGGHRLAAIEHLQVEQPDAFDKWFAQGVPVHVVQEADHALAIEIAENCQRKDYTPAEVRGLAERLKAAGYHGGRGKPKKGTKAVGPTLEIIVGKSRATIERYLAKADEDIPSFEGISQKPLFNGDSAHRQVKKWLGQRRIPKRVKELLKELESELQD